ncbi:hypothetical protein CEXT_333851 [Caerostris extrusa]|uniref:Secreted protein n=1 Tax=Caerostris extrusa TaxID=172846 RepID=A0AAV4N8Q7_CAEEX|nr:hypothetical protein CEXT_333851 [Caerostris extrusa]
MIEVGFFLTLVSTFFVIDRLGDFVVAQNSPPTLQYILLHFSCFHSQKHSLSSPEAFRDSLLSSMLGKSFIPHTGQVSR